MYRAAVVVGLILAVMVVIKDGRALQHVGILSSCTAVVAPAGDEAAWHACRAGKLEGRPNLARNACESRGVRAELEYWRCPAPIGRGTSALHP